MNTPNLAREAQQLWKTLSDEVISKEELNSKEPFNVQ